MALSICYGMNLSPGLLRRSSLQTRRVRCEANIVSSGSKIVKRFDVESDPFIMERTICLVIGPSTALYRSFLKHCTLTNKAVGTI